MHSIELGNGVPAFLVKLWKLVEDPESSELICWSPSGLSFIIHDQSKFAKELLPLYFKHNNVTSFIRQLNMYGFRKVMNVDQGRLKGGGESDDVEFFHQYFLKGKMNLLEFIKRKVPSSRTAVTISTPASNSVNDNREEGVQLPAETVQDLLSTMSSLKTKQEGVDSQLHSMKQENEALWREVAYLRQKHIKQQQIVDKLIHFLVSLVQPKRNISVKRKLPLMLQDSSSPVTHGGKAPRLSRQFSNKNNSVSICSPKGPVIHDVTDFVISSPHPVSSPSLDEEDYAETLSPVVHIPSPDSFVNSPLGTEEHMEPLSILDPLQNIEPVSPAEELGLENNGETIDVVCEPAFLNDSGSLPQTLIPEPTSKRKEDTAETEVTNSDVSQESHMQVALSDNNPLFKNNVSDHLEGIESELAWLQEQLSNGSTFNLDTSTLLGLFSTDDTVPGNNLSTETISLSGNEVMGNELMQYVPSLLDLDVIDDELAPESPGPSTDSLQMLLQKTLHTPTPDSEPSGSLQS